MTSLIFQKNQVLVFVLACCSPKSLEVFFHHFLKDSKIYQLLNEDNILTRICNN